tara:strand:+ start:4002 stop:4367 length:366 start_codon:yes stop_codon:yes gene_type:complete
MSEKVEMKLTGKIKVIDPVEKGTSKAGKEWQKVNFVITNNEGYEGQEQIFAFEVFGEEKVEKFIKYNKVGVEVDVKFNIKTNEYKGKYYTSLQAWSIFKVEGSVVDDNTQGAEDETDGLPF